MSRAAGNEISPATRQISPLLSASAVGLVAVGITTGLVSYLHRLPIREAHDPGTSAWTQQLILAAAACALYGVARWRHGRRPGRGSGRLLLLAPLGRSAASRLAATMRQTSWRSVAALPPLAMIGYSFWRIGEQVTAGLDPNFTANAWGGPTYLGAMACFRPPQAAPVNRIPHTRPTDALAIAEPSLSPARKKTARVSRHPEVPGQQPCSRQRGRYTARAAVIPSRTA